MRRLVVSALLVTGLSACSPAGAGGAFQQVPSPAGSSLPRAHLDSAALGVLEAQLAVRMGAHVSGGHAAVSWGPGAASDVAGPYRADQLGTDAATLFAAGVSSAGPLATLRPTLAEAAETEFRGLDGPQGGASLLLAGADGDRPAPDNPCVNTTPSTAVACLRAEVSDGLLKAWYAADTRQYFQVGATSTVYRPVEAFAVGCALLIAGYSEHNSTKISAGMDIVRAEMTSSLDPHFRLVYSLATRTAGGGFQPTDATSRLADQVGIAEMLLEAFDLSREEVLRQDAQKLLTPLLEADLSLHTASGLVSAVDTRAAAPAPGSRVDVEATLLALRAAAHYDSDAAPRFAVVEEDNAAALLALGASPAAADGLPAEIGGPAPAAYSGLVTALAVVALAEVRGARPAPLPTLGPVATPSP